MVEECHLPSKIILRMSAKLLDREISKRVDEEGGNEPPATLQTELHSLPSHLRGPLPMPSIKTSTSQPARTTFCVLFCTAAV